MTGSQGQASQGGDAKPPELPCSGHVLEPPEPQEENVGPRYAQSRLLPVVSDDLNAAELTVARNAQEGVNTTSGTDRVRRMESANLPTGPSGETRTTTPATAFGDWTRHLPLDPPTFGRVGRFESLNDVTGRTLRVYRKSPHPPRRPKGSPRHDSD